MLIRTLTIAAICASAVLIASRAGAASLEGHSPVISSLEGVSLGTSVFPSYDFGGRDHGMIYALIRRGGFAVRRGARGFRGRGFAYRRGAVVRRGPVVRRGVVVRRTAVFVRRPVLVGGVYRPYGATWIPGGAIAAGAAVGFVTAAAAAAWAGRPPVAGYCWYYTDASRSKGFWDVCPR